MENEHEQMETGADTGDARENSPDAPGFTAEHDRLFRSHFQHANRLADRSYESMRPAYEHGWSAASDSRTASRPFEEVERDLEAGWLNVRTGIGDWASVREYVRAGYAARAGEPPINRVGFVADVVPGGGDDTNDRPPFADPVADAADPTAPWSPEQTLSYQHEREGRPLQGRPTADQGGFGYKSPEDARKETGADE